MVGIAQTGSGKTLSVSALVFLATCTPTHLAGGACLLSVKKAFFVCSWLEGMVGVAMCLLPVSYSAVHIMVVHTPCFAKETPQDS